jgi:CBS domain-containing protein
MTSTVMDVMSKRLVTIKDTDSVQDAARKLQEKEISSLIVVDRDGKSQGLVTERDIVTKVCTNDMSARDITTKQIMSVPLIAINSTSTPAATADMMLRNKVRHLLVVDDNNKDEKSDSNNNLLGIITPLDFARFEDFPNEEVSKDEIEMMLEYYI